MSYDNGSNLTVEIDGTTYSATTGKALGDAAEGTGARNTLDTTITVLGALVNAGSQIGDISKASDAEIMRVGGAMAHQYDRRRATLGTGFGIFFPNDRAKAMRFADDYFGQDIEIRQLSNKARSWRTADGRRWKQGYRDAARRTRKLKEWILNRPENTLLIEVGAVGKKLRQAGNRETAAQSLTVVSTTVGTIAAALSEFPPVAAVVGIVAAILALIGAIVQGAANKAKRLAQNLIRDSNLNTRNAENLLNQGASGSDVIASVNQSAQSRADQPAGAGLMLAAALAVAFVAMR